MLAARRGDAGRADRPADGQRRPDRAFCGRDQVRENWSSIFAAVPETCELKLELDVP